MPAPNRTAQSPGDASASNARMRMSAIDWPVAAILPLDNIGGDVAAARTSRAPNFGKISGSG